MSQSLPLPELTREEMLRYSRHLIMPEVTCSAACCENQEVIVIVGVSGVDDLRGQIDTGNFFKHYLGVFLAAKHCADGSCDISRRKTGYRYLIEQWLNQMVVGAVDQCDAYLLPL